MFKVVFLQFSATAVAAALAAAFFGAEAAFSAAFVGLAFAVPNGLMATYLTLAAAKTASVSPIAFFVGEGVKLLTILVLLVMIQVVYAQLHWGGFLLGLIFMLKANLFAFLVKT